MRGLKRSVRAAAGCRLGARGVSAAASVGRAGLRVVGAGAGGPTSLGGTGLAGRVAGGAAWRRADAGVTRGTASGSVGEGGCSAGRGSIGLALSEVGGLVPSAGSGRRPGKVGGLVPSTGSGRRLGVGPTGSSVVGLVEIPRRGLATGGGCSGETPVDVGRSLVATRKRGTRMGVGRGRAVGLRVGGESVPRRVTARAWARAARAVFPIGGRGRATRRGTADPSPSPSPARGGERRPPPIPPRRGERSAGFSRSLSVLGGGTLTPPPAPPRRGTTDLSPGPSPARGGVY